ncbi:MAG: circadian clock protein KaiC [Thermoplasmata archaeon]|nr:MAG: circadian clock protein KaiC [Thermoplasmata archaeon]
MAEEFKRLPLYINGLDEKMEGGIPEKSIVLVCGRAGTMKSSVCFNALYQGAIRDKRKGIYLTLEQSRESLLRHMRRLGMDVEGIEEVVVIDLAKVRKDIVEKEGKSDRQIDWIHSIVTALESYKRMFGCDLLVLDSLAALYALTEFKNPRAELFHFFERLRDLDVTALLISEMPMDREVFGLYGVEDFLADGIIHLHTVRKEDTANLYININKLRATNHDRGFYPLIFENGQFEIVSQ